MKLHFASVYTAFLQSSLFYTLNYQPALDRDDKSRGDMWLKRFVAPETNDQGQSYLTLQAPFGITLDDEKQEGLNVERLSDNLETLETLNTLGERGVVRERLAAFPEMLETGSKICLFKRAIFDRSGKLVGGGTRLVEYLSTMSTDTSWLTVSDQLYAGESAEYAGGSNMLFEVHASDLIALRYVTFSGAAQDSLLTFKVMDTQSLDMISH